MNVASVEAAGGFAHRLTAEQSAMWASGSVVQRIAHMQLATALARKSGKPETFIFDHEGKCLEGWNNQGNYQHGHWYYR